jgi:hypothetical protein
MVTLVAAGWRINLSKSEFEEDFEGMAERLGPGKRNWLRGIENEKIAAKQRGEKISDEEAKQREVVKLHRPHTRQYHRIEVEFGEAKIALPNCVALEPKAVHAKRRYGKITREAALMIEEGRVQPDEIRFMCS